ncbi:MAG: hypothetical protein JXQ73_27880 [Phycisphaerae bacterium]|nr:hypothetical protein [Phycisphaerae bacterium]
MAGRSARAASTFAGGVTQGTVSASGITEASGLVASRHSPEVLWTHNDSGDVARVFAISTQGALLATYNITEPGTSTFAPAVDFEDIAIGPGPREGVTYLYVGDIGDNGASRASILVYRIAEPVVYVHQSANPVTRDLNQGEWQSITLQYPDGAHNAEGIFVDPLTGDLFIVTKVSVPMGVYQATKAQLESGTAVTMSLAVTVNLGSSTTATAAEISPSGRQIIIKGYGWARLFERAVGQSVADALGGTPVSIPVASEPQGEAITFDAIGDGYFTLSEGRNQPLYYYERTSDDGPTQPTPLLTAASTWRYLDDGSDQGTAWRLPAFDDGAWDAGPAQLGYGDGDEQTVVDFGSDPNDKVVTTYFRRTFDATDVDVCERLVGAIVYDDGAAVYLNGTEVFRAGLDPNAAFDTPAGATQYALENAWFSFEVDPNLLVEGTNTLAVEIHQVSPGSSDLSFDLSLTGTFGVPQRRLTITEFNGLWGDVTIDPEPNDANEITFPAGTVVTLTAAPAVDRALRHWLIFDPSHPDDANHAAIDANNVMTLTLDTDRHVEAVWMCGGSAALPLVLMTCALAVHWIIRRRTARPGRAGRAAEDHSSSNV